MQLSAAVGLALAVSLAGAGCKWRRAYYVPYAGNTVAQACVDRCSATDDWEHFECLKQCPGLQKLKRCPADLAAEAGYCDERDEFSGEKTGALALVIGVVLLGWITVNAVAN